MRINSGFNVAVICHTLSPLVCRYFVTGKSKWNRFCVTRLVVGEYVLTISQFVVDPSSTGIGKSTLTMLSFMY